MPRGSSGRSGVRWMSPLAGIGRRIPDTAHDCRPHPDPAEEEHGETETRRRPERRDRAVEIRQLQADLAREVVRAGQTPDGSGVQRGAAVPSPAPPADPSAQANMACGRAGYGHRPHDLLPTLFLSAGEVTGACGFRRLRARPVTRARTSAASAGPWAGTSCGRRAASWWPAAG